MNLRDVSHKPGSVVSRPCPSGHADHRVLEVTDDSLAVLELPRGSLLHVDRARRPANGDLVWVELVRRGSIERLVRRYAESNGFVTLSLPEDGQPAIMRRPGELLVLGVAEPLAPAGCPG